MIGTLEDVYSELNKPTSALSKKYMYSHKLKTKGKTIKMSLGRIWFNVIMPEKYALVNEPVTKSMTSKIINELLDQFGPEVTADTVTSLNREAFKLHNFEPITFNDSDFILPPAIEKLKKERLEGEKDPIEFDKQLNFVAAEFIKILKKEDSALYKFIASGAKGKPIDMAVLLIARGSAVDIEGNISVPTANSINDGFTLNEFYDNANQARNGLYIRSIGAAEPGALARDIAYANSNIKLTATNDCKTRKHFKLEVTDKISKVIIGRFYVENNKLVEITPDNVKSLIGKTIKMRSPLYCIEPKGICHVCYGTLADNLDQVHIGLAASSVLNQIGLNAFTMKQRHSSSVVNFDETDLLKDLIR